MTSNSHTNGNDRSQSLALLERIAAATEANATAIQALADEVAGLRAEIDAWGSAPSAGALSGNGNGAESNVPVAGGKCVDFQAETVVVTLNEEGQPAYKIKGARFVKFGVRVWPEVLPMLGLDPQKLKPGPNPYTGVVRALLNEEGRPKKVIGPAG